VNKGELIDALTGRLGDKKVATEALDAVLQEIQRAVAKGDKVSIAGFGVFEKRTRGARVARNPRTGEPVKVKKTAVPAFRAGQGFKDVVTGKKKVAKAPARKATTGAPGTKMTKATRTAPGTVSTRTGRATAAKATAKKATAKATKTTTKAAKPTKVAKTTAAKSVATKRGGAKATAKATKTTSRRSTAKKASS